MEILKTPTLKSKKIIMQLRYAQLNSIFICDLGIVDAVKRIANRIDRGDILVFSFSFLLEEKYRSMNYSDIILESSIIKENMHTAIRADFNEAKKLATNPYYLEEL